jgi:transposase
MNARANCGVGKSDPLDARRIAEAALPLDEGQLRHPCSDEGEPVALRVLVAARDHMTGERTATVNALTALVRAIDLASTPVAHCAASKYLRSPAGAPEKSRWARRPLGPKPCAWPTASTPNVGHGVCPARGLSARRCGGRRPSGGRSRC